MVKNLPANARGIRDMGSIPGSGRFPGEGNGNLLKYSFLENSTDRGTWQATVYWAAKESDIPECAHTYLLIRKFMFPSFYYCLFSFVILKKKKIPLFLLKKIKTKIH